LQEDTNAVVNGNRVCISRFLGLPLFHPHVPSIPLFPFAIAFSSSSSSSFLAVPFAVPSPPPSQQPLSLWHLNFSFRIFASAATTTMSKCFYGHPHHQSDPYHHHFYFQVLSIFNILFILFYDMIVYYKEEFLHKRESIHDINKHCNPPKQHFVLPIEIFGTNNMTVQYCRYSFTHSIIFSLIKKLLIIC